MFSAMYQCDVVITTTCIPIWARTKPIRSCERDTGSPLGVLLVSQRVADVRLGWPPPSRQDATRDSCRLGGYRGHVYLCHCRCWRAHNAQGQWLTAALSVLTPDQFPFLDASRAPVGCSLCLVRRQCVCASGQTYNPPHTLTNPVAFFCFVFLTLAPFCMLFLSFLYFRFCFVSSSLPPFLWVADVSLVVAHLFFRRRLSLPSFRVWGRVEALGSSQ